MSTIIGSPEHFGIEYELLPGARSRGTWMYGKCCYWVAGDMVGNYELGASLRDVLLAYPYIVSDSGKRSGGALCDADTVDIFDTLEGILYRGDILPGHERYVDSAARFSLKPLVDVFDGYRAYCLSCAGSARLIYRCPAWPEPREARTSIELVEASILRFYAELNEIYESSLLAEQSGR